MADPATMAGIGLASTALGGITGAAGAKQKAAGAQLDIQGQMLKTIGQAFQFQTEAANAEYRANSLAYQSAVAYMNENIAKGNATYAQAVGEVSASEEGLKERAAQSQVKTAQSASGTDVNVGSNVNVRESMIELAQTNQAVIRANAAKVAYNYSVEAVQDDAQAKLFTYGSAQEKANAANDMTAAGMTMEAIPLEQQAFTLAGEAGDVSAAGSLLSATASVASKWQEASKLNLFGGPG